LAALRAAATLAVSLAGLLVPTSNGVAGTPMLFASPTSAAAPPDGTVNWVVVSPAYSHSGLVLAAVFPFSADPNQTLTLWVSHDGGATWHQAAGTRWDQSRVAVALDQRGREVLLAGGHDGLERSDDYGETWQSSGGASGSPVPLASFAHDQAVAVASAKGDYVAKAGRFAPVSGSHGVATDLTFGIPSGTGKGSRFADPVLGGIDRATSQLDVFRCTTDLSCDKPAPLAETRAAGAGLTFHFPDDYDTSGTLFVQTGDAVLKSTDGAASFTPLHVADRGDAIVFGTPGFAMAPGYSETGSVRTLYVAVAAVYSHPTPTGLTGGGVFRSVDAGQTWQPLRAPTTLEHGATALAIAPDGRLFAGFTTGVAGHGGLLCSADGGSSWQSACAALDVAGSHCTSAACGAAPTVAVLPRNESGSGGGGIGVVPLGGAGVGLVAGVALILRRKLAKVRRPR
jgi:hypothetical protein